MLHKAPWSLLCCQLGKPVASTRLFLLYISLVFFLPVLCPWMPVICITALQAVGGVLMLLWLWQHDNNIAPLSFILCICVSLHCVIFIVLLVQLDVWMCVFLSEGVNEEAADGEWRSACTYINILWVWISYDLLVSDTSPKYRQADN